MVIPEPGCPVLADTVTPGTRPCRAEAVVRATLACNSFPETEETAPVK